MIGDQKTSRPPRWARRPAMLTAAVTAIRARRLLPGPRRLRRAARRLRGRRGPGTGHRGARRSRRSRGSCGRGGPNRGLRQPPAVRCARARRSRSLPRLGRRVRSSRTRHRPTRCALLLLRAQCRPARSPPCGGRQRSRRNRSSRCRRAGRCVTPKRREAELQRRAQARSLRGSRLPKKVNRPLPAGLVSCSLLGLISQLAPFLDKDKFPSERVGSNPGRRGSAIRSFPHRRGGTPADSVGRMAANMESKTPTSAPLPAVHPEDVLLRDGSTLRLRPPHAGDVAALISFFEALSPDSRYLRFHGATLIDQGTVAGALETDWRSRGSLVAELVGADGGLRPFALATYVRLHDPARAEVAFAVADEMHGRGIGTRLLERLAAHASASGIDQFVAEVLPQNVAMLRVLADAGFRTSRTLEGGVIEVLLELGEERDYEQQRD